MSTASKDAPPVNPQSITEHERKQVERANATKKQPIVFVHGLWLLPSSWDRWAAVFEEAGYTALTPGWPDDPDTVDEANRHPQRLAGKGIDDVAEHFETIIGGLKRKPAIIGHSFGGLLAQILAGRELAAATVAIDPAPFRGVLPLPISSLKSGWPVLGNPANRNRAVPHLRPVPLCVRQRRHRGGGDQALREIRRAGLGDTAVSGRDRELDPWTEARWTPEIPSAGRS